MQLFRPAKFNKYGIVHGQLTTITDDFTVNFQTKHMDTGDMFKYILCKTITDTLTQLILSSCTKYKYYYMPIKHPLKTCAIINDKSCC